MSNPKIESPPEETVSVHQVSVPLLVTLALACASASGIAAYTTAMGDTRREFIQIRLETEQRFVKQSDLEQAVNELRAINTRLSNMEGFMRANERRRRSE